MAKVVKGEKRGRPGRYVLDYRDANGIRRWLTFTTYREAHDALKTKIGLSGQSADRPAVHPNIKLGDYAERWLASKKLRVKPQTYATCEKTWRNHLETP